jgi:purine-cytosine permease-like protein
MRTFQIILAIITLLMALGMFGFNLWIGANFSKGLELPQCYTPMNYITAALILITVAIIFIRK